MPKPFKVKASVYKTKPKQMYINYTKISCVPKWSTPKLWLMMRLVTIILIATMMQVHANGFAQKITLSRTNTSLKAILKEIKKQSGYVFLYTDNILKSSSPVTIDVVGMDFKDALKEVFENQPLSYTINEKTIALTEKKASSLAWTESAFVELRGKVYDEKGKPLSGANITIKGSDIHVTSNESGAFAVATDPPATLVISFVGYATREIPVNSTSNNLEIYLTPSVSTLKDVLVTDSYSSQAKKTFTGSASIISSEVMNNKPFSGPLQVLQGQVAGLNVTINTGQPGADVEVRLRGVGSLGLNSNPLYVIDGIVINAGDLSRLTLSTSVLSGINNNDIENITVLKDAAAIAIYGSRGANGVIVINTKKGKNSPAKVTFDTELGVSKNIPLPERGRPLNAADYSTLFAEGLNQTLSPLPPAVIQNFTTSYGLFKPGTDWYDLVTQTGQQQQFNVSVRGGNEQTKVFTSAGYFKQDAAVIGSSFKRLTGLLNIDQKVSEKISLVVNLNGSNANQNSPSSGTSFAAPVGAYYFLRPTQQAYNLDGSLNSNSTDNTGFPEFSNPLYINANDKRTSNQTRILANTSLKYDIWRTLKYTGTLGLDYDVIEENQFRNPVMGEGKNARGLGIDYYTRYYNWLARNQLDYRQNILKNQLFYFDLTLGYEAQRSQGNFISASASNYPGTQSLLTASANASTVTGGSASFSNYAFNSIYSRASINYQDKYVFSGSYRNDGSSRFGRDNARGNFWSVGLLWNMDEELFFKAQNILSSTKIRGSYGQVGNAGNGTGSLGNYSAQPTASYGSNYAGNPGQNFNTIGNTFLSWETVKPLNIGADLGFFADRLVLNFDYYNRAITGLIQNNPISRTTGFSTVIQNVGNMRNRGVELMLSAIPIKTEGFNWKTSFNISFNKNEVTKLANGDYYNQLFHIKEGQGAYTWSLPISAGVNPDNGQALWYTDGSKTAKTNAYNINALQVDQYQADPKYFGGWSNAISFRKFQLSADLYFNAGNHIIDQWSSFLADGTQFTYGKYAYNLERWTAPGQVTDVPKYVAGGGTGPDGATYSNSSAPSTRFLYKGDYIRLKNMTLGYDFSELSYLKKAGLSKLFIYCRGTNLFTKTFDNRLPFDPEVGFSGSANLALPQVRTFTFGLNVTL